jgi:hypothetical protein
VLITKSKEEKKHHKKDDEQTAVLPDDAQNRISSQHIMRVLVCPTTRSFGNI